MNKNAIIAIVVILVLVVGIVIFAMGNHTASQTQPQTQPATTTTQASQATANPYTSTVDGFSVNFPATPEVTQTSFVSPSAGTIPLSKYTAQAASGANYVIYVYHYPSTYTFSSSYLSEAMKTFVNDIDAKYPGTKVENQSQTQLLGSAAISAVLSLPIDGNQVPGYVLITTKNQNTYGMATYGVDQNTYNAFVNSFAYTQ